MLGPSSLAVQIKSSSIQCVVIQVLAEDFYRVLIPFLSCLCSICQRLAEFYLASREELTCDRNRKCKTQCYLRLLLSVALPGM